MQPASGGEVSRSGIRKVPIAPTVHCPARVIPVLFPPSGEGGSPPLPSCKGERGSGGHTAERTLDPEHLRITNRSRPFCLHGLASPPCAGIQYAMSGLIWERRLHVFAGIEDCTSEEFVYDYEALLDLMA